MGSGNKSVCSQAAHLLEGKGQVNNHQNLKYRKVLIKVTMQRVLRHAEGGGGKDFSGSLRNPRRAD